MSKNLYILGFVLLSYTAFSQEMVDSTLQKPKIGLVLSGGGAKGFAHIGVLKVLEEQGIKPDYITGTSMGALVAALYSLGYSPQQMEDLVTKINWNKLFSNEISYKNIPILYKPEYSYYPLHLEVNKGSKLSLPSGMIEGHNIQALFSKLVWNSFQYTDYDSFPIPYRCVATDLLTAKAHVFKSGNLAEVMRASMSIPTVFSPIEKDTLLLIDGGAVRNFPVQDCKKMGADIIIGVYTGLGDHPKKEDLTSMLDILTQSSMFYGVQQSKRQAKQVNLYIEPIFNDLGPDDFNQSQRIIDIGETAARDSLVMDAIHKIESLNRDYKRPFPIKIKDSIQINKIKILGCQYCDAHTVIRTSKLKTPIKITANEVDNAIDKIYSSMQFKKVSYDIKTDTLLISVKETNRTNLNLGLHYDNSDVAAILLNINSKHLLLKDSEFSGKLAVSANPRMNLRYKYYPTNRRRLEFSLNTYLQLNKIPDIVKEANDSYQLGHYVHSFIDIKAGFSWAPLKNFMLYSSFGRQLNSISLKEGMELYYNTNTVNHFSNYYELGFKINSLDNPFFPAKGLFLEASFRQKYNASTSRQSDSKFDQNLADNNQIITFDYKQYFLIAKRFSIIPEFSFGVMENKDFITQKFFLGGQVYNRRPNTHNMSGLKSNYLATDNFFIIGASAQMRFYQNWYAKVGVQQLLFINNTSINSETEPEFEDNIFSSWYTSIGYQSKIGPLRFIVSKSPEHDHYVYSVNIGFPF